MSKPVKTQSKSEFIRSQPPELTANEVVKKAKEVGIAINEQRVYAIRSAARKKLNRPSSRGNRARTASISAASSSSRRSGDQISGQFVALVADIGLVRAEQLFAELKARLTGIKLPS